MTSDPVDGTLREWGHVASLSNWGALLLGNGLSVNVWPRFAYSSLFETARAAGKLVGDDLALFRRLRTSNFEAVLSDLRRGSDVLGALGRDAQPLARRYRSVQRALAAAMREVHPHRAEVPGVALSAIKQVLREQAVVFTTNYDLLIYWAMGYGETFTRTADLFWTAGAHGTCQFDQRHAGLWPGWTPLYYLHGGLHLIVHGDGTARKLTRGPDTLLEQFDRPVAGDPSARPLLVSEGTAGEKRRAIEDSAYLHHALSALRRCQLPLVIFGSSLSEQDSHLTEAINEHPQRPVAVAIVRGSTRREVRAAQARIRARLETEALLYFDAATHPLGNPYLRTATTNPATASPMSRERNDVARPAHATAGAAALEPV
jgi:hypothetical protein